MQLPKWPYIMLVCCWWIITLKHAQANNGIDTLKQGTFIVAALQFTGLKKTKVAYLQRFLQCKIGRSVSEIQVVQDAQHLRNLPFFAAVSHEIEHTEQGVKLTFNCLEKWTMLPIVNGNVSQNRWGFSLGVSDINLLGKGIALKGIYHYYDRHSFELSFFNPYLGGSWLGLYTEVAKLSSLEPLYWQNTSRLYHVDTWKMASEWQIALQPRHALGIGLGYLNEKYTLQPNVNVNDTAWPIRTFEHDQKVLAKLFHKIDRRDYEHIYGNGWANNSFVEMVWSDGEPQSVFFKFCNEFLYYKRIAKKGNLTLRNTIGLATNTWTPFLPFVWDSYQNVRGIGNRVARGTGEVTLNLEYHQTLLDVNWLTLQSTIFSDWSTLRAPEQSLQNWVQHAQTAWYAGGGMRINLTRFSKTILRVDYGYNVLEQKTGELVIGIGHYF